MDTDIKTLTSSAPSSTDQNQTSVTGTDVTVNGVLKRAIDTFLAGGEVSSIPSGLSTAGLITTVALSTGAWTALPASALTKRNSLAIQNTTGDQIRLNFSAIAPAGEGWIVNPNGEFFIDITDAISIYARAVTGTPTITVMELS